MLWAVIAVTLGLVWVSSRKLSELDALRQRLEQARTELCTNDPLPTDRSRAQVAELNEVTIDMRSGLATPGLVPGQCARAAFATGALASLVHAASLLGQEGSAQWFAPVAPLGVGLAAAVACRTLGRLAERRAARLRDSWDGLIRRSRGDVPT